MDNGESRVQGTVSRINISIGSQVCTKVDILTLTSRENVVILAA